MTTDWIQHAACRGDSDPDRFFYEVDYGGVSAKQTCAGCTVREACLTDALEHDDKFGIRGGLGPSERQRLTSRVAS